MRLEYEKSYWNNRYLQGGDSGAGSQPGPIEKKVQWLSRLDWISSVVEIGCGDFQFGRRLMDRLPSARYWGYDVSQVVVERNQKLYGLPRVQFFPVAHGYPAGVHFPMADLLMCVDVLFHVIDDGDYCEMIQSLRDAKWRYLAVTAYEYDGPSSEHLRIRKFDPSVFGEPVLREVIEEDGQLQFYIFQR